jgi:hypothetical protein
MKGEEEGNEGSERRGGMDTKLHINGKIPPPQETLVLPHAGNKVVDVEDVGPPVLPTREFHLVDSVVSNHICLRAI